MNPTNSNLVSITIYITCFVVFFICTLYIWILAKKNEAINQFKWLIISLFVCWFTAALFISFQSEVSFAGLILIFLPICFGLLLTFINPIKLILTVIPIHWLIYLQVYRVAGFVFVYLYFTKNFLTKGFAFNAGFGDIITGLAAIFTGYLVQKKYFNFKLFAICWNIFVIVDLIVAPLSAAYFGAKGLNTFPLIVIPFLLGPPLGILLHICCLRSLYLQKSR